MLKFTRILLTGAKTVGKTTWLNQLEKAMVNKNLSRNDIVGELVWQLKKNDVPIFYEDGLYFISDIYDPSCDYDAVIEFADATSIHTTTGGNFVHVGNNVIPSVFVLNKSDKPRHVICGGNAIKISALNGHRIFDPIDAVKQKINTQLKM